MKQLLIDADSNRELIITFNEAGYVESFTKDTLNTDYNWKIYVDEEEFDRQVKILEEIDLGR